MLNKLTTMPTLFRLSLCLMASAGVHGGVVYYDGASHPSFEHNGRSAVVVALVTAAEDASFSVVETLETFAAQDAAVTKPATIDRMPPAIPSSPPAVKPPRAIPQNKTVVRQVTEVVEDSAEEVVSTAPVCLDPRQNLPDHGAEAVSITDEAAADAQSGIADVSAQEVRPGPPDESLAAAIRDTASQAQGPHGGALIEAMPNYRNNPLPEYPFIARQRHWQGVVWLLVDVSAKGLVEDVDLEQSCGYRVLDRAASRAVQNWEFTPAKRAGLPVASQVRIPVRFSLEGS